MAKRKKEILNQSWESNKPLGGKYTKICDDMMNSMAWHELSLAQRGFYLTLKKKYTKNSKGETNENDIHITAKDLRVMGISKNTRDKYLDALIEHGFIRVVYHGKTYREPNIYGFSDMWICYNTEKFVVTAKDKRLTKDNTYTEK